MRDLINELVEDRQVLENAPLKAVLCQARFPKRLRFDEQSIGSVQEALSDDFPLVTEDQVVEFKIAAAPNPKTALVPAKSKQPIFRFQDPSMVWRVTVAQASVSLETKAYKGFRDLLERWVVVAEAVRSGLRLSHSERLGVRYVNQVEAPREKFDYLRSMLQSELMSFARLRSSRTRQVQRCLTQATFQQPEGFSCNLRYGIAPVAGSQSKLSLLLDIDCFDVSTNPFVIADQLKRMVEFNKAAREFFDDCFTEVAHSSFSQSLSPDEEGI